MDTLYLGAKPHDYTFDASYDEYLSNKIYNEGRLFVSVNRTLIMNESGSIENQNRKLTALYEAKIGDKVKANWNKFIEFIKKVAAKFMEAMSNILLSEQKYLEKYKNIILEKKPKDLSFEYTGDYDTGIKRIIQTEIPMFDNTRLDKFKGTDEDDINEQIVKDILPSFDFDNGETLENQFKTYFAGGNQKSSGKFSQLNFTNIYNFCYNYKKIEEIVNKDIKHLEDSTNAINNALHSGLNNPAENAATDQTSKTEGFKYNNSLKSFNENIDITNNEPKNTNAAAQSGSYSGDNAKNPSKEQLDSFKNKGSEMGAEAGDNDEAKQNVSNDIDKVIGAWIRVCRALITAKWTAAQQISKDYMSIIREHVKSYGGKKEDSNDNKSKDKAENYAKFKNKPEQQDDK